MELLNEMFEKYHHTGRLAVKESKNEDCIVYVVWEIDEQNNSVRLVELDNPLDGDKDFVDLNVVNVYLLDPLEVIERVIELK
ncbi:hypothetical protein [Cytobacillus gottheilii]|uniref:hypothetical protein n=1 Tax=Cytobacillus gottheilii TaxID=859144 RepID=UPI0009BB55FC|nr:hypothetical protein [Cytobacillus gottheilii]